MKNRKTIVFSYQLLSNIGCEIIIRGSIAFLTRAFPDHHMKFVVSSYDPERDREILEDLPNVEIVPMVGWKRIARGLLVKSGLHRKLWTPRFATRHFRKANLFVSVGGDIYTMPGNALPIDWLGLEKFATQHGIPSIMFGANMEKFEVLSLEDRERLLTHLRNFQLISVRDHGTRDYLAGYGISDNVEFFPDPIFMLRPQGVFSAKKIKTIGINATPILLRDFGDAVFERLAGIVTDLHERKYQVKLIPHVYASNSDASLDDRIALKMLHAKLPEQVRREVVVYDGPMSFAEISREIGTVDLFVGARMHSCLNAVTLGKPTYFLSYSGKARTMVEWLSKGPLNTVSDRIACGPANEITLESILDLVSAHEAGAVDGPVTVDFDACLADAPIWRRLAESGILRDP